MEVSCHIYNDRGSSIKFDCPSDFIGTNGSEQTEDGSELINITLIPMFLDKLEYCCEELKLRMYFLF